MGEHDSKCGACNHNVPIDHEQYIRIEHDNSVTCYHTSCGRRANELKPCIDCGYHRAFCDECKEMEDTENE